MSLTYSWGNFKGVNNYQEASLISPNHCQTLTNMVVKNGTARTVAPFANAYTTASPPSGTTFTSPLSSGFLRKTGTAWHTFTATSIGEEYQDASLRTYYTVSDGTIWFKDGMSTSATSVFTPGSSQVLALYPPPVRSSSSDTSTDVLAMQASGTYTGRMTEGSYRYIFTFVNHLGFESAPSEYTDIVSIAAEVTNGAIELGSLTPASYHSVLPSYSSESHAKYMRIYRIHVGVTDTYQLVDQIDASAGVSFYIDVKADNELGTDLTTDGYLSGPPTFSRFTNEVEFGQITVSADTTADVTKPLVGMKSYLVFLTEETSGGTIMNMSLVDMPRRVNGGGTAYRTKMLFTKKPPSNKEDYVYLYRIWRLDETAAEQVERKYYYLTNLSYTDFASLPVDATTGSYIFYDDDAFTDVNDRSPLYGVTGKYKEVDFVAGPHNGSLYAAKNNRVWRSQAGNFSVWHPNYWNDFPGTVKALVPFRGEMVVLTDRGVHRLVGDSEANIYSVPVHGSHSCNSGYAVATPDGVLYFTSQGTLAVFTGEDTFSVTEGVIAANTILPGRMYYVNDTVYITQPTTGKCWVLDMGTKGEINFKLLDYTGSGYYLKDWWHDGTRLYAFATSTLNGGTEYILTYANASDDPTNTAGLGPVAVLKTGEITGTDPEAYKYFSRSFIEYESTGNVTATFYRDGTSIRAYTLPVTTSKVRKQVNLPSGQGRRLYIDFTTTAGVNFTLYRTHAQYNELTV